MKLIDLLVQELPKRGGWPDVYDSMSTNKHGWVSAYKNNGCLSLLELCIYSSEQGAVTRAQYEAALSAAQQPVWDGAGVPPVGERCEFKRATGDWIEVEITAIARNGLCFVEPGKTGENYVSFSREFRPARSESDKKRDKVITALVDFKIGYHSYPKAAEEYLREVTALYNAIAAGKIPGVKLDD